MKQILWLALTVGFCVGLVGCGSARVFDNRKTIQAVDQATIDASSQLTEWRVTVDRQQQIFRFVETKKPAAWISGAKEGRQLMLTLALKARSIESAYQELLKARADFSAFALTHAKVYSSDPLWADNDRLNQTVTAATENFNAHLKDLAQATENMSLFWHEKGLFQIQKVPEMALHLQADAVTWREHYTQLVTQFNQGQVSFSDWHQRQPNQWNAKIDTRLDPLQRMHGDLATIAKLIHDLDRLKEEYIETFTGLKEINTMDREWTLWQTFRAKQKNLLAAFAVAKTRADKAYADLQSQLKGLTPVSAENSGQTQSPQ